MTTLREAAQQALEAWDTHENGTMDHPLSGVMEVLRAALEAQEEPRREWRGLTDDEVDDMSLGGTDSELRKQQFARAIEAALKEKNHE